MEFKTIELAIEDGVATITLNRPEVLNAINWDLVRELEEAVNQVRKDDTVRVVVITGAGEKAFAAGADIHELKEMNAVEVLDFVQQVQRIYNRIERMPKPIIAAVNGYALGGGLELMMACDIVYASERAKLGLPEINLGIIPGAGGTQRLPRLIGGKRAKELLFTGEMIDAQEALRIGLVNKVIPHDQLRSEVKKLCEKIKAKSPVALRAAKEAVEEGYDLDLVKGLAIEAKAIAICFSTEDSKEGLTAYLEKRKPVFKGR